MFKMQKKITTFINDLLDFYAIYFRNDTSNFYAIYFRNQMYRF